MIDLNKTASVLHKINISKAPAGLSKITPPPTAGKIVNEPLNLNFMPHYKILPDSVLKTAQAVLADFKTEFGEVKSATLMCEKIKQAKRTGAEDGIINELQQLRLQYSKNVKAMRNKIWKSQNPPASFEEYIVRLKQLIKENGSYINCNECADLTLDALLNKGIKADNVLMYTVNDKGERTSFLEHVFSLAGLKDGAKINDPSSWGKAVVCDGWAGISMPYREAIKFYEKFFNVDFEKNKLMFEFCNKKF